MITGAHSIIYSRDADGIRTFFRDVLKLPGGGVLGLYEPRHPSPLA